MKKSEITRGKNFLESERILLIKLCNKYKHIIECKRSDMNFLRDKETAWNQVTRQFNAAFVGGAARTTRQLQEKYKNIKKDLRKRHAEGKKYVCGTGGGPYKPFPDTKTEEEMELFETIRLSADGITNEFDTDGRYGICGASPHTINIEETSTVGNDVVTQDSVPDDWTDASSFLWRTPKNPKLNLSTSNRTLPTEKKINISTTLTNNLISSSCDLDIENNFDNVENIVMNTEQEQEMKLKKQSKQRPDENMNMIYTNREESSFHDFDRSENAQQEHDSKARDKYDENNKVIKESNEYTPPPISRFVGSTSRRRPVLKGKKKTVSSAGEKFELAAQKKISLVEHEMLVSKTKFKQMQEEHKVKMEILQIRKDNEILKNTILKEGKMIFEF